MTLPLPSVAPRAIAVGWTSITMARLPNGELGHLPFGKLPLWSWQGCAYQASVDRAVIVAGDRSVFPTVGGTCWLLR